MKLDLLWVMGASAPLPHHHFTSIDFINLRCGWLAHSIVFNEKRRATALASFFFNEDKWNVSLEWDWSGLGPKYITHYSAIQN